MAKKTSKGALPKTAPKIKAPKWVTSTRRGWKKAKSLKAGDVAWFSLIWFPATLIKYTALAAGLAVGMAAVGAGKASRAGYRHARPHLARAGKWAKANAIAGYRRAERRAEGRWAARHGKPMPTPPAEQPRVIASAGGQSERPAATAPAPQPQPAQAPSTPAGASGAGDINTTGGHRMQGQEFQRLVQAHRPIAQMDPKTAWELDEQFAMLAAIWPKIAEFQMAYIENLDRNVKVDPRIIASATANVAAMNELWKGWAQTRRIYRELYKWAFESSEGVRIPDRKGFWNKKAA